MQTVKSLLALILMSACVSCEQVSQSQQAAASDKSTSEPRQQEKGEPRQQEKGFHSGLPELLGRGTRSGRQALQVLRRTIISNLQD